MAHTEEHMICCVINPECCVENQGGGGGLYQAYPEQIESLAELIGILSPSTSREQHQELADKLLARFQFLRPGTLDWRQLGDFKRHRGRGGDEEVERLVQEFRVALGERYLDADGETLEILARHVVRG